MFRLATPLISRLASSSSSSVAATAAAAAAAVLRPRAAPLLLRTFSSHAVRYQSAATTTVSAPSTASSARLPQDSILASALKSEIEHESSVAASFASEDAENTPKCLEDLLNEKVFSITALEGGSEVNLIRELKTQGETVTVTFSIDDVENAEYLDSEEQGGMEVDEHGNPIGMGSSSSSSSTSTSASASAEGNGDDEMRIPVSVVITITKKELPGALVFQAVAEDGAFNIGNVSYLSDSSVALEASADADYRRRGAYMGPSFESLDDGLREAMDTYLAARGIDDNLAEAIPLYVKRKEQEEYRKWLARVHDFVKA